ncbi:putative metalloprotease CJM1_0395 family protein [Shewanella maritima]|uniref:putative metalloprotease CJM1_0395 family protein n=1 Tax=Shewanella maritima TaxID=2520507 RepID=UPI003734C628
MLISRQPYSIAKQANTTQPVKSEVVHSTNQSQLKPISSAATEGQISHQPSSQTLQSNIPLNQSPSGQDSGSVQLAKKTINLSNISSSTTLHSKSTLHTTAVNIDSTASIDSTITNGQYNLRSGPASIRGLVGSGSVIDVQHVNVITSQVVSSSSLGVNPASISGQHVNQLSGPALVRDVASSLSSISNVTTSSDTEVSTTEPFLGRFNVQQGQISPSVNQVSTTINNQESNNSKRTEYNPSITSERAVEGETNPQADNSKQAEKKRQQAVEQVEKEIEKQQQAQQLAEQKVINELSKRDTEVRNHEQAHASVGGSYAGQPTYQFEKGPDGKRYAVEGEVQIDVSEVNNDPQATVIKMQQVYAAALAPVQPSSADIKVASEALSKMNAAKRELVEQRQQQVSERDRSEDIIPLAKIFETADDDQRSQLDPFHQEQDDNVIFSSVNTGLESANQNRASLNSSNIKSAYQLDQTSVGMKSATSMNIDSVELGADETLIQSPNQSRASQAYLSIAQLPQ